MTSTDSLLQLIREDDFVEYYLFPPIESKNNIEQEKILSSILEKANKIVNKYVTGFLWHKDPFKLSVGSSLHNKLNNIDDGKKQC